jgi:serine/threonine protein kinase
MESTGNEGAADRAALIARLVSDVRNARAAGKSVDDELILSAHPQLMPELREELQKLNKPSIGRSASRTGRSDSIASDPAATRMPGSDVPTAANVPSVEVPGYNILKELGRGGQAVVFLALQLSTGRRVAVKVTYEGPLADERSQARFNREVRALAALQHPNIVAIIDTGRTADGNRYIVMDYIAGWSLDEYMKYRHKKDPTDPSKLLRMFLKICAAMNVAHSQSIIHRDLKPTNIRVDERGEPHILDFGLARSTMDRLIGGSNEPVSITGEFLGSIPWSSPEQAEGNPDKIDVRTDVYSLGVILYQMITGGRFPYEVVGNIRDVLNNILTAAPTPPSKAVRAFLSKQPRAEDALPRHGPSGVNEALEKVVLKALAKKPEKRYQSAGELGRDIANYLAGEKTAAREAAITNETHSTKQKSGLLAAMMGAVAISLIAVAGFGGWRYLHKSPPATSSAAAPVIQMSAAPAPATPASILSTPVPEQTLKPHIDTDALLPMMLRGKCRLSGEDLCITPVGPAEAVFLIGSLKWSNYDFTFRAIANAEGAFNVLFHWTDPGTYYVFCPGSLNNRSSDLFKRVEKGPPQRAPGQLRFGRLEPDRWYQIHLEVRGSTYRCYVDNKLWLQTQDEAFTHGKCGIGVWNPNNRFRDIKVTAPDGSILWSGPPDLSSLPRFAIDRSNLLVPPLIRIDLLGQVDPVRNTLAGTWTFQNNSLLSTAGSNAQIEFPYTPTGDYDYRIDFSRSAGESPISVIFLANGKLCDWVISGHKPTITGFASIDGERFDNNHTTNHYVRPILENSERHTLVITLRSHQATAYIDGSQSGVLRTDESHVTLDHTIAPPRGNRLGLRIGGDAVTILAADVLPVAVETARGPAATHTPTTEPAAN